ncbi:hypothetical protein GCM10012285_51090 [Streptomyces kronopolitis]|uniref:Uncharacterized protein n=1 Tax=Streptomyces kronopolitis TaxID=1612435 RepID=A0ABQ2JW27_9ACTN|nr:hypothetical protein [Streptomyces kronopolitis]GGN56512.1 hypothetical protein GCM10012285_51090 [Streptomyces kronopolitis]
MPGLEGAAAVLDPPARQHEENPGNHAFYHDLFAMFGEASDPDQFAAGPQNTHRHLTELLAAHPSLRERSADLVVVAHALPDSQPYGVTASHAGLLFGDDSHGFAVSEQGLAAPFTALRILSGFWCSGRTRRPVLLVLEQTTLPVRDPAVHGEHPLVDSGALLAFGGEGSLRLRGATDIHLEVAREELTVRLNAVVDQDPEGTLVVLGPSAAERCGTAIRGQHRHEVAPGTYATGVWVALADNWTSWQARYRRIVLCDLELATDQGCMAVLYGDPDASGG